MAGFIEHLALAAHPAGANPLLGLLAAAGQAPLHQHHVQALFACHGLISHLAS
jgi:hypothetical protein